MDVLSLKASHVASALGPERDISTLAVRGTEAYIDHSRAWDLSSTRTNATAASDSCPP
ncbi:MAG: hypothetical protein RL701_7666 [Pseudomonadota bacterium]|jgi:hypothetical protein